MVFDFLEENKAVISVLWLCVWGRNFPQILEKATYEKHESL